MNNEAMANDVDATFSPQTFFSQKKGLRSQSH